MSKHLLTAAMLLAYGPFVLMALLYLVGLVLRLTGRPGFLHLLIERTKIPQPVNREEADGVL